MNFKKLRNPLDKAVSLVYSLIKGGEIIRGTIRSTSRIFRSFYRTWKLYIEKPGNAVLDTVLLAA